MYRTINHTQCPKIGEDKDTMPKKLWLILLILIAAIGASEAQSLEGCPEKCGNVDIPYPFGVGVQPRTGHNCFLDASFQVTCDENGTLFTGNLPISEISLTGFIDMSLFVSRDCYNESGQIEANSVILNAAAFTVSSTANKFISIGCDTFARFYALRDDNSDYVTGCLTECDSVPDEENSKTCSGVGCCEVDVPLGMKNINFTAFSFENHTKVLSFNNCSYAFVARKGWFNFSIDYLTNLPYKMTPLVVDWAISDVNCQNASTKSDYACTSNSYCVDSVNGYGYNCICKPGFEGNPYHPHGCQG